jgi:hypothetical protein
VDPVEKQRAKELRAEDKATRMQEDAEAMGILQAEA